ARRPVCAPAATAIVFVPQTASLMEGTTMPAPSRLRTRKARLPVALALAAAAWPAPALAQVIYTVRDLGTLGGTFSVGNGINASGQVTGLAYTNTSFHAFRTTATGTLSDPGADLGTLGGTRSVGHGINDSGQVTGGSSPPGDPAYGHA